MEAASGKNISRKRSSIFSESEKGFPLCGFARAARTFGSIRAGTGFKLIGIGLLSVYKNTRG